MVNCPECETENDDNWNFCLDCGHNLSNNTVVDNRLIRIPPWNQEFANLESADHDIKQFYMYWVSEIEKDNFIYLGDNLSYIYSYLYSTIYDFIENEDIKFLSARFDRVMEGYSNYTTLKNYLIDWKADAHLFMGDYENSLKIRKEIGFNTYNLETYGYLKDDSLINGEVLVNYKYSCLTNFGKKNKNGIAKVLDTYLTDFKELYGKNIVRHFLEDYNFKDLKNDFKKLKRYFDYERDFNKLTKYYSPDNQLRFFPELTYYDLKNLSHKDLLRLKNNLDKRAYPEVFDKINPILSNSSKYLLEPSYGISNYKNLSNYQEIHANKRVIVNSIFRSVPKIISIQSYTFNVPYIIVKTLETALKKIIRESENLYREEKGIPRVGEGWVSETELYYKIKEAFPAEKIIHHGRPKWLGRQHLDIYFPKRNIAIEYQGLQHDQPVEFFGGEEAFKKRLELDTRKREICIKNNCYLIHVYPNYDFKTVKNKIKTLLK
ncbi:zinc ribbon domain-containing protein [Methanobacterium sp. CWC-01]|uniref:hypothetical protein n=1 Tax=Methanobacterium aridiramus TaxID=2584467 RepID=UPI002574CAB1|nr:hypothetical protein [Methanobacterium sp. CWC-01]WJI08798.1 zinc ribbon domain-containing protein [Methanobacterium sp. CWC-01]